jgi:hypothetical protein
MTLWHAKVGAFVELLEQLGAFQAIRTRRLIHSARRVVLVITDSLGEMPGVVIWSVQSSPDGVEQCRCP